MVAFYNDVDVAGPEAWVPAVQYYGTRGFFPTYDARPADPLLAPVAKVWAEALNRPPDPMATARRVHALDLTGAKPVTAGEWAALIGAPTGDRPDAVVNRGDACRTMFEQTAKGK
jgi:hypothetical protein